MTRFLKSPKFFILLGMLLLCSLVLSRGRIFSPDGTRQRFDLVMRIFEHNLLRSDLRYINSTGRTWSPQGEKPSGDGLE